ncbi:MAG: class I SAM-dependent methyltransferase [Deltaproteobacteria bacterium]
MASIVDNRGYSQGFALSQALTIRTRRRVQAMLDEMDVSSPRTILELGCGTGEASYLLSTLTTADVIGVDLCESFIQSARENYDRPNLKFIAMDLLLEDVADRFTGKIDYIVGNGILHHLRADLPQALLRLNQLLSHGGRFIFWEPNLANPYLFFIFRFEKLRRLARLEPNEMAFYCRELVRVFESIGLTQIHASCRDFLLPNTPGMLIKPAIWLGAVMERIPCMSSLAQSIFIVGTKQ